MIGRRAAFPRRQTRAKLAVGRLALVPFGKVEVPGSPTPGPDQRQAPVDTQSWSWALGAPNCQLPTRERANLGLARRPTRSASRLRLRARDAGQCRMSRGPRPVSQSEPSSLRREPCLRVLRSRIANGSFSARDWATSHRDDLLTASSSPARSWHDGVRALVRTLLSAWRVARRTRSWRTTPFPITRHPGSSE